MTAPPAAAIVASAPGPVPPPVAGAPAGKPSLVASGVAVMSTLGKGLGVTDSDSVGELVPEPLGEGEAVHEGEAVAVGTNVGLALAEGEGEAVAEGEGEAVPVTVGLGEGEGEGEAVWVEVQPGVSATATPLNGPVSAINVTETTRVAVPAAKQAPPTLCSSSQAFCRDPGKIVTIP